MRWAPGETAELTVTYTDESGNPVDVTALTANIFDPDGVQRVTNGVPVRISEGFYRYEYDLAENAALGLWRIDWAATYNGGPVPGEEVFEVSFGAVSVDPTDAVTHSRLRSRLGEIKTDPDGDGSETFFTDDDINDLLNYSDHDLDLATLEGWRRKMARYSRLIDIKESGSDRPLSQKFKNAKEMVAFWSRLVGSAAEERQNALAGRVTGRAVNLRCDATETVLTPFSGYSDHVREYPTHRLLIPAILS